MKRILLIADPIHDLKATKDTSLCLTQELLRRGDDVFYYNIRHHIKELQNKILRCSKIEACDPQNEIFLKLEAEKIYTLNDFDICLHRLDPPVDKEYLEYLQFFIENAPKSLLQVNNPQVFFESSEHSLPMQFPNESIPTQTVKSPAEIFSFMNQASEEFVLKPNDECAGKGIQFIKKDISEKELKEYLKNWGPEMIIQPFREAIYTRGDHRILCMNGKILGNFVRRAKEGSRLSNIHQGGSVHKEEITERQKEISLKLAEKLKEKGVYLIGFDFIGDEISEINYTSPMGIVQINELSKNSSEKLFADELEKLYQKEKL